MVSARTVRFWIAATPDEYELPVFVAETQEELANCLGVTKSSICKTFYGQIRGAKPKKYKILKIEIKTEEKQ